MPKKFYKWEVVVSCTVYNRDIKPISPSTSTDNNGWPFSHNSSRSHIVYCESKLQAKEQIIPLLEPEKTLDSASIGIHVSGQYISNVYCLGEVRKITQWEVVDKDAHPHWSKM